MAQPPLSQYVSVSRPTGAITSKQWFNVLLGATNTFPWESDLQRSLLTFVGDQSSGVLGYEPEACLQSSFWLSHIHEADIDRIIARNRSLARTRDYYELEYRMVSSDGRVIWVHDMVSVVRVDGKPEWLRGFTMDITSQKENEGALRDLGVRLMTQQEEERKRVARELHDDLSQRMAIFCIDIESLTHRSLVDVTDLGGALSELNLRAKEISGEIHRVAYGLHPAKLDDLGLPAALNSLCSDISQRHKIDIRFTLDGDHTDIPADFKLCLYRVAQEALSNVVRHSRAKSASVALEARMDEIRMTISDTGRGLDNTSAKMRRGLGFVSMTERLRILSGDISITSGGAGGTTVEARLPMHTQPIKTIPSTSEGARRTV